MRITHIASGAVGIARDERKQSQNKKLAFRRMAESPKFKKWLKIETSRHLGVLDQIEKAVEESIKRVKVESKNEDGRWTEGLTENTRRIG